MPLNTAEYYDPKVGKWTEISRMNQCRFGVGCAVLNDMVYAVGGSDGTNLKTVERYDPDSNTWKMVASMSTARSVWFHVSWFDYLGHLAIVWQLDCLQNANTTVCTVRIVHTKRELEVEVESFHQLLIRVFWRDSEYRIFLQNYHLCVCVCSYLHLSEGI